MRRFKAMQIFKTIKPWPSNLKIMFWLIGAAGTLALITSAIIASNSSYGHKLEEAHLIGRGSIQKDILYQRWNAKYGGVYVSTDQYLPPHPNIEAVQELGATAPPSTQLELVDPTNMIQQVFEATKEDYGIISHITSLVALDSAYIPDKWETNALRAIERGLTEVSSLELMNKKEYLRLMLPLYVEAECLECHSDQGFTLGDIQGGISVYVPMDGLNDMAEVHLFGMVVGHMIVWLIGIISLTLGMVVLGNQEYERSMAEEAVRQSAIKYRNLSGSLDNSNRLKELLLDIITHDIRNPVNVILGVSSVLMEEDSNNKKAALIVGSTERLMRVMDNATVLSQVASHEQLEKSPLDLSDMLDKVLASFVPTFEAIDMKVDNRIKPGLYALANPIIEEIFANYISNAAKYATEGEKLIIASEKTREGIRINFIDFGNTIEADQQEEVFMRSIQLDKGKKGGRGLGLSIVKYIAASLGAKVGVEKNEPKGNIFFVELSADFTVSDSISKS